MLDDIKQSRGGMEPVILDDLKRIIMRIKDCDPAKPNLASLFLLALPTGAMAHSCAGVCFSDFFGFLKTGDNEYTITVNSNSVKGLPGKKLTLRLGGNP